MNEQLIAVFLPSALVAPTDTYVVPSLIANAGEQAGWRYTLLTR